MIAITEPTTTSWNLWIQTRSDRDPGSDWWDRWDIEAADRETAETKAIRIVRGWSGNGSYVASWRLEVAA